MTTVMILWSISIAAAVVLGMITMRLWDNRRVRRVLRGAGIKAEQQFVETASRTRPRPQPTAPAMAELVLHMRRGLYGGTTLTKPAGDNPTEFLHRNGRFGP